MLMFGVCVLSLWCVISCVISLDLMRVCVII